jgi:preprotein translocase subunit YajC
MYDFIVGFIAETFLAIVVLVILIILLIIRLSRKRKNKLNRQNTNIQIYQKEFPVHNNNKNNRNDVIKTNPSLVFITLILGFVTFCVFMIYSQQPSDSLRTSSPNVYEAELISPTPPIPFPNTSPVISEADLSFYAPFTVNPPPNSEHHYFIRLKHKENRYLDRDFYMKKGETLETFVLYGEYDAFFASGIEWYGTEHFFGARTIIIQADDPIVFFWDESIKQSMGSVIYLEPVLHGNLSTTPVSFSDFNK